MTTPPRVLVTGASGFVGRHCVHALSEAAYGIRAASRNPSSTAGANATMTLPELSKAFDARVLTEGVDYVVHLAGVAHATGNISEEVYSAVNAGAAAQLARAAREAGVRRFVFVSSVRAQTGSSTEGVVTEKLEPKPVDAYGRSKLEGEHGVAEALAGSATELVILRPVLVYGHGVKGNMASLMQLARGPLPLPLGSFEARRSLISAQSLAGAIVHCLTSARTAGGTFLAAEKDVLTIAEIVSALRSGLGRRPGLFSFPEPLTRTALRLLGRTSDIERLFGDLEVSAAALEATGWHPAVTSREGLAGLMKERPATTEA